MLGSSSVQTPLPTLRPRASWMIDDGDERTEVQADADWHRANEWLRTPPAPPLRNHYHHCLPLDGVLPHPPTVFDAPPFHPTPAWGPPGAAIAPDPNYAPTITPWQPFSWGDNDNTHDPESEPIAWGAGHRRDSPSPTSSDSLPDTDPHLQSYAQPASSFKGGTTVNAIASVRDPLHPRNPLATKQITIGLDSYSDVTVAHRDIVYNVRPITERLSTGGGLTHYNEEGLIDIVDGPCSFRTLPALVASHPSHLPKHCMLLLGVQFPSLTNLISKSILTGKQGVSRSLHTIQTLISPPTPDCSVTYRRKIF